MDTSQLKDILKRYHIHPNKTYGQNFLMNEIVLQDIADSVPLKIGDAVLEVGPGLGNLTKALLAKADLVLAVEKDKSFLPVLHSLKKEHKNLRYEIADILEFNFQEVLAGRRYHVAANIPYYITGKIIQLFIRAEHKPETITLLVQKEVAENVIAKPGRLNLLAISVQLYANAEILQSVPARDFYPAPKVDSAVLRIKLAKQPKYEIGDEEKFFRVLRACFSGKRKQIHNTLQNNLKLDKAVVDKILSQAGIKKEARPQELSIEEWIRLVGKINL